MGALFGAAMIAFLSTSVSTQHCTIISYLICTHHYFSYIQPFHYKQQSIELYRLTLSAIPSGIKHFITEWPSSPAARLNPKPYPSLASSMVIDSVEVLSRFCMGGFKNFYFNFLINLCGAMKKRLKQNELWGVSSKPFAHIQCMSVHCFSIIRLQSCQVTIHSTSKM